MILIGTSGYSYSEWKGSFYPSDLPASQMLAYYTARFSTVEINNTFYRMPSESMLTAWATTTPADFVSSYGPGVADTSRLLHRLASPGLV